MNVTSQLEKCQEESRLKDQTITQLTQKVQKLESELRGHESLSQEKSDVKQEKAIRQSVKLVISSQAHLGHSYNYSLGFDHPSNQSITEKVKADMSYLKTGQATCSYSMEDVISACKTHFSSQRKAEQRKSNGTYGKHRTICRSTHRKKKKEEERKSAAYDTRVNLTPDEREKAQFMMGLGLDVISSDESEDEGDLTDRRKRRKTEGQVMKVKEFFWASEEMKNIRDKLDCGFVEHLASDRQRKVKALDTMIM